jgi:hypothetical protein
LKFSSKDLHNEVKSGYFNDNNVINFIKTYSKCNTKPHINKVIKTVNRAKDAIESTDIVKGETMWIGRDSFNQNYELNRWKYKINEC